jgi:protein-disulfide isomerase
MAKASLPTLLGGAALIAAAVFGAAHMMALESEQRNMMKELQEIKALLRARPAAQPAQQAARPAPAPIPANLALSMEGAAVKGKPDARLTIVEFSDFECPFCGRYSRDTFDQVQRAYVDTGKVRYAFRHYPLESMHPRALKAGVAAECSREQGKFWELHTRLFADQQKLSDADLRAQAGAAGVNLGAFDRCLAAPPVLAKIRRDLDEGARAGVTGTPFFFLGVAQKDGTVKVLNRLSGAQPFDAFKTAIDALLASPNPAT